MAVSTVNQINPSTFIQPSIPVEDDVIYSWSGERTIRLIRIKNQLLWEVDNSVGAATRGPISVPENINIEQAIAHLITLEAALTADNKVTFRHPPAPSALRMPYPQAVRSQLDNIVPLPWQSLKSFTASTTLSEKVWRVVNNLLFVAAGISLYAIGSRSIVLVSPALSYASYVILALTIRKIVSTIIGYVVYPAIFRFSKDQLARQEEYAAEQLKSEGFITQKITLYKSGVAYDATIIGHKDTIANGKWCIHAFGNGMAMEHVMDEIPGENLLNGANTLLVNSSAVGRSKGFPTRYQKSAGFEAGLQFLEKEVKATHIAFKGLSLGGGMMSEAVLNHEFDLSKVRYLGISDRTFSRLSDVAAALVGFIVTPIFYLSGAQLDSISGAEKLKQLKIEHIIIQHTSDQHRGTDGIIPDRVSLAPKLEPAPTRTFLLSPEIPHIGDLPSDINTQLNENVKAFFGQVQK